MIDNSSSPMKKRKANDGRATADGTHDVNTGNTNDGGGFLSSWFGYFSGQRDGASSGQSRDENNTSQLDRMEVMMMRMEEKLATVESRCETLEAKCSSLENMLVSTSRSTKEHIDRKFDSLYLHLDQKCSSLENRLETKVDTLHEKVERSLKFHEYNEMLIKNQSWEYSADVDTADELIDSGYTYDEAEFIAENAQDLKFITTKMRRGEFPYERYGNEKGVHIDMDNVVVPQDGDAVNNMLLPHWKEFAAALKQFPPAINLLHDEGEGYFHFDNVQLGHNAMLLIKKALIGKPFRTLSFTNNDNGEDDPAGMSVDAILDIVESSKHLRELGIGRNRIGRDHIERLCSAVRTHALMELDLSNCFEPGIGDAMLTCLLTIDDLKLENLYMCSNNITSGVSTVLADFLATNPRLKELHLEHNNLNYSDAALIATALRSNTTLRYLHLHGNDITDVGAESLRLALYDESSLNATADSNHTCTVYIRIWLAINDHNSHEQRQINRGWKIYSILSTRNETMSNVQHFGNIDVKLLPNVLDAVQKYATSVYDSEVNPCRLCMK
ncbi:leucine-rich repeat protein [Skeletonema marinoi]|uniref:Leucine-rich repeat protein n=1 Tax=Skeletonema marinoi TaxID=267567 RepID=A0AAD8Y3V2_9STRA|nr:leucine-rich repeat protein [Skeletonema marinoi]